jgi:uncharacterized membrane protein YccC
VSDSTVPRRSVAAFIDPMSGWPPAGRPGLAFTSARDGANLAAELATNCAERGNSMESRALWRLLCDHLGARRAELRFCLRVTAAGLLALAVVDAFNFPLRGLWAVLTAIVVTQTSVGGSLRATVEYFVGTLGGAIYAAALGVLVPHATAAGQALVLALAVAPLALAAALYPSFRVAPFSAVLVLLIGGALGESPVGSALTRILEVALGGAVAVAVSVLVLPDRAYRLGLESAVRILDRMAEALPPILAGFGRAADAAEIRRTLDDLGQSVAALDGIATEARRERLIFLAREPDPAPLARTVLRLRNDLIMLRRAAAAPLPEDFARRLGPPLDHVGETAGACLRLAGAALAGRGPAPPLGPVADSLQAFESEVAALRGDGLTRGLSIAELERLFTLGFALEQLGQNLSDLARRAAEFRP